MKKVLSVLLTMSIAACMVMSVTAEEAVDTTAEEVVTSETAPVSETESFTLVMQINNPDMIVNGVKSEIDPGEGTVPVIVDERTLVPVRAIVEAMGGKVDWDGETQTAILTLGEDTIKLTIGSTTAYLNDTAAELDVTPVIINERTMLPIRFISESFNFNVLWDGEMQTIIIIKESAPTAEADNAPAEGEAPVEDVTPAESEDTAEEAPVEEAKEEVSEK